MGEGDQACGVCVGSALVLGLREVLACCCLGLLNGQNGPAKEGVLGLDIGPEFGFAKKTENGPRALNWLMGLEPQIINKRKLKKTE